MFRKRIIPVLLLKDGILVKSIQFSKYRYIGEPLNAVKLFNQMQVDELLVLDISATKNNTVIPLNLVQQISEEADMPLGVGGGITTLNQIQNLLYNGADKVVLGTAAALNPNFVVQASKEFGASAISVCVDVKKNMFNNYNVKYKNATHTLNKSTLDYVLYLQSLGAGEIIIQSVNKDGMMGGYDDELIKQIANAVSIPVVALGGAKNLKNINQLLQDSNCAAAAAGSCFVYYGTNKGVLINYFDKNERGKLYV